MARSTGRETRPTLKTVAAETGLAVATVSRALSDAPDIGAATKARVREAALRLGYRPDRAAVRLRTGRTQVIALLLGAEPTIMTQTAQLIHAFAATLRGTGYHLVVTPVLRGEDPLVQVRYLVETGSADAVILNRIEPKDPRVAYLARHGMPFVTHGRSDMGLSHPWYDFDNAAFARLAVRALAARGRRDLLVVAPPLAQSYARHILDGVRAEAAATGMGWAVLDDATTDAGDAEVEAAVARRLAAGGIDAVLCASVSSALATVAAVEGCGREVGRDVDIAAKEPFALLGRFRRPIIAVREDAGAAGEFLARAALDAIRRPGGARMTFLETPDRTSLD